MNLLRKVCKELGVEINKEWLGSDGFYYCIDESGQIEISNEDGELLNYGYVYWEDILTGLLKPAWRPECGETYYVPVPTASADFYRAESSTWADDNYDEWALENGLVFETKEAAIKAAHKMLEAIK